MTNGHPSATITAEDIEAAARALGYDLGWRFLMCPEAALRTAPVALVAMNPGGRKRHGPEWSCETGNAYWTESWGGQAAGADPLQRQVQRLAAALGLGPAELLCAQFVPFRSNSWSELPRRLEALAFSQRLWSWALTQSPARLFICLGKPIGMQIAGLLGAGAGESVLAGWGDQTIDIYRSGSGVKVVALPHLGRFKLMGRSPSEAAVVSALRS